MAILDRFGDIVKANINALLDKMEDPAKMIDQYLRNLLEDLAEVKSSTAAVMAEETRTKRLVDANQAEVAKYLGFAQKALEAGNEGDARTFIAKKQQLESAGAGLMTAYATAHENAGKMRQMHDKLVSDIQMLQDRREMIKAKVTVAKTQQTLNKASGSAARTQGAMDAFDRMEGKANQMLDEANAMTELNMEPIDEAKALEKKYADKSTVSIDEELARLKTKLGLEK